MSESIVRPLEWRQLYGEQTKWPKTWHGIGIFGRVVAVDQSFANCDFYCFGKGYGTLEEAKAAAQSGYEATVLSALSPSVASLQAENERLKAENERLRDALKPFSTFADDNVEFVPFDPLKMQKSFCWNSNAVKNDRIFEWFGPSDFGNARAALGSNGNG